MANPNLIGGGRMTRGEMSENSSRRFQKSTMPRGALLRRFWRYLGRNRGLLLLAMQKAPYHYTGWPRIPGLLSLHQVS